MLPKPLTFQRDEILDEPDRCGFRLVAQVYDRFEYWEKDIPQEFDRERGRLCVSQRVNLHCIPIHPDQGIGARRRQHWRSRSRMR